MICCAQELLKNHMQVVTRLEIARIELGASTSAQNQNRREKIASMVLTPRVLDGMPRPRRRGGSSTEYVALHYEEQMAEDQRMRNCAAKELQREIGQLKIQMEVYAAILRTLTKQEARFVALRYDEGLPLSRIKEISLTQNGTELYSVSTLRRMNQAILEKANSVMKPWQHVAPGEGDKSIGFQA